MIDKTPYFTDRCPSFLPVPFLIFYYSISNHFSQCAAMYKKRNILPTVVQRSRHKRLTRLPILKSPPSCDIATGWEVRRCIAWRFVTITQPGAGSTAANCKTHIGLRRKGDPALSGITFELVVLQCLTLVTHESNTSILNFIGIICLKKLEKALKQDCFSAFSGTPDTIRTCDLQSRSLSLYPAELRAHINFAY